MKGIGKIAVCIAGGLAFSVSLRADDPTKVVAATGNPYLPIVERNVFGLLPPPVPPDPNAQVAADLPKITASGIMNVFGNLEVLFKTSPSKPGAPDNYYDLSEGQSEDNIEVVHIDEKAGMVTFENNGTQQQIALVDEASSGSGGGGGGGGGGVSGGFGGGHSGFNGGYNGGGRFGSQFPSPGGYNGGNNGGNNSGYGGGFNGANNTGSQGLNFNGGGPQNRVFAAPQMDITPEQQQLLMEANRATLQSQGNPMANIIPPTPLGGLVNGSDDGSGSGNSGDNSQ